MDMYMSGAACRAVFNEGTATFYVDLDRPEEKISFGDKNLPIAAISRLLGDCRDGCESRMAVMSGGLVR